MMTKIDNILRLENETEIVIQIGEMLRDKFKNDANLEPLNEHERNVLYIEMLKNQVNHGGFEQYFANSAVNYAYATLDGLRAIEANQMAEIFSRGIAAFPASTIPTDRAAREEIMDDWDELDSVFYEYPENLTTLLLKYVTA